MKTFSFVLTLVLLLIGVGFLAIYIQTCFECSPALVPKTLPDEFTQPDIIFAIVNFIFALFSVYLMFKRKFHASAIISGVVAGLQVVAVGAIFILKV